jgi:mannose-6-phosphate isomerase-like protein (cupin superfamily)
MRATSKEEASSLTSVNADAAETIVWRNQAIDGSGVVSVIGPDAPLDWDHGFNVDRIAIAPGEGMDWDGSGAKEVLFIDRGSMDLVCTDGLLHLTQGDTISLPTGFARSATTPDGAVAFLVYP